MSIIKTACSCGQSVEVRTGSDSEGRSFRRDGKQAVYPGESGYSIFRCRSCSEPLDSTCPEYAYSPVPALVDER
jgi:hypothetical protein